MASTLFSNADGCSNIISVETSDSHGSPVSTAVVTCVTSSLNIGDYIEVDIGYVGNHSRVFAGYVKTVERKEPERLYTITANNILVRAIDYFIVSTNPKTPFTRKNITAERLVEDVLALSGITSFTSDSSGFTFATKYPLEVNLTSAYDYSKFIADIIAFHLYADNNGVTHFVNRTPFPQGGDPSVATLDNSNILNINNATMDTEIRNRVVVYGANSIFAESKTSSPYLPAGFFKSVVIAAPTVIDTQAMANQTASFNLTKLNRLTQRTTLSIKGDYSIEARDCVTINKSDIGVTGKWYCFGLEHQWSKGGFITNIEARK